MSLPQDLIVDPVNPNVDGVLENIKRLCKVVTDEKGVAYIFLFLLLEMVFTCHRARGSGTISECESFPDARRSSWHELVQIYGGWGHRRLQWIS